MKDKSYYKRLWNEIHTGWPQNQQNILQLMEEMNIELTNVDLKEFDPFWEENIIKQRQIVESMILN